MISKERLLKQPNYLLSKYQIEIFRQLDSYRKAKKLTQKSLAKELGVSTSYINQILKGKFNFTLRKLIELGIAIGKIPSIEFVGAEEFWEKQNITKQNRIIASLPHECQILVKVKQLTVVGSGVSSSGVLVDEDLDAHDFWVTQSLN